MAAVYQAILDDSASNRSVVSMLGEVMLLDVYRVVGTGPSAPADANHSPPGEKARV